MSFMSKDERKEKFVFEGNWYVFTTVKDLSTGIEVSGRRFGNTSLNHFKQEYYSVDLSLFFYAFFTNIFPRLNGFQGLDCVTYSFDFGI